MEHKTWTNTYKQSCCPAQKLRQCTNWKVNLRIYKLTKASNIENWSVQLICLADPFSWSVWLIHLAFAQSFFAVDFRLSWCSKSHSSNSETKYFLQDFLEDTVGDTSCKTGRYWIFWTQLLWCLSRSFLASKITQSPFKNKNYPPRVLG